MASRRAEDGRHRPLVSQISGMKTTMPAMLDGTAVAVGMIAAEAATSATITNLIPTRLLTRRSTAQR